MIKIPGGEAGAPRVRTWFHKGLYGQSVREQESDLCRRYGKKRKFAWEEVEVCRAQSSHGAIWSERERTRVRLVSKIWEEAEVCVGRSGGLQSTEQP